MFADNLRKVRVMAGLSQAALAAKLGVPRNRITAWELRRAEPSFSTLARLALLFGVSVDELLDVPVQASLRPLPSTVLEIAEKLQQFSPVQLSFVLKIVNTIELENQEIGKYKKVPAPKPVRE